jgi:hypothetical protein
MTDTDLPPILNGAEICAYAERLGWGAERDRALPFLVARVGRVFRQPASKLIRRSMDQLPGRYKVRW